MSCVCFRDIKGQSVTDTYFVEKIPIEQIQQPPGRASKNTIKIYIKQGWRETAKPNMVPII